MSAWDKSEPIKVGSEKKPIKRKVLHKECKTVTVLGLERAAAFALNEDFDSELYCAHCQSRKPLSEFTWIKG